MIINLHNNISNNNPIRTNIFPCKSINLVRFLKQNGLSSEYKFTDAKDNKDCWIFLRTNKLHKLLEQWKEIQNIKFGNKHKS